MHRYGFLLFATCFAAIAIVLLLRPDPAVKLEAELARLEPQDALERLSIAEGRTQLSNNLYLMYARLAFAAGDLSTSRKAYERVLGTAPDTVRLLDELGDLAAIQGDLAAAARFKDRAQTLNPNEDRRQTLGYWFRLLGDSRAETALLTDVPAARLTVFERRRLAELHLGAGDVEAYRAMLTVIARVSDEHGLIARRQLMELNIESGDPAAALELALSWVAADPQDRGNLETGLRTLVGRGAMDEATRLADAAIVANPDIGSVPVNVLMNAGHGGIARRLQAQWLASDRALDDDDWAALSVIAERSGDLSALRHVLSRAVPEDRPPPPEAFLQFLRYQGPRSLLPYGGHMTPDMFARMPLLGAAWHGMQRLAPETYDYLVAAADSPLTDWDRSIWMSVANGLRGTPFYRELLANTSADPGIVALLRHSVFDPAPTISPTESSAAPTD